MSNIVRITSALLFLLLLFLPSSIQARDFTIDSAFNVFLEKKDSDVVRVKETLDVKALNENFFIPSGSQHSVLTKKDDMVRNSISIKDRYGRELDYTLREMGESFQITVVNDYDIKQNRPFFVEIEYETTQLINQNGNITNLYLPGLHEETVFRDVDENHGLVTTYNYQASYHVPLDAPEASYISPVEIYEGYQGDYRTYNFPQKNRVNNTGWIQLGNEQFYSFKITQQLPQTDFITPESISRYTNWLSRNILELAIPREFSENNQEVYFTNISPKPKKIRVDEEGNIIGVFQLDAKKDQQVTMEGYIRLSQDSEEIPDFAIDEYKTRIKELSRLDTYTQPDTYWESDHSEIQSIANELFSENNGSIMELIRANYYFVIDQLEYSHEKALNPSKRHGALEALRGAESVCMEYADLMIAILRAQGIPTRAAFGYGNDPLLEATEREIGHQWVQIWLPDYGWLSVDPTWGESGREYIGGGLDHLLWYAVGTEEQAVSDFALYSADTIDFSLSDKHTVEIEPLHKSLVPELSELDTTATIVDLYSSVDEDSENSGLERYENLFKTTVIGRALIFIAPIIVTLVVILTISMIISKILKRSNS